MNWKSAILAAGLAMSAIATAAAHNRSVILVLDASGSMRARLAQGETRIDAAKAAVAAFAGKLDPSIRLGLRAYGHQSPTSRKDCSDTGLVVPFAPATEARQAIAGVLPGIAARGYTPITYVIGLAADDLGREAARERVLVLVSDGQETCKGDPCLAAKKLAAADASLVIHTIGFAADDATRLQLQCVARAGGGRYLDAKDAASLAESLSLVAAAPKSIASQAAVAPQKPGQIEILGPDRHKVFEAETGREVTEISATHPIRDLSAGLYNVGFPGGLWKSVEVRPGEKTVLKPARLALRALGAKRLGIVDAETGEQIAGLSSTGSSAALIPARYRLKSDTGFLWPEFVLNEGERRVLENAKLTVRGARVEVMAPDGTLAAELSSIASSTALPPGSYIVMPRNGAPIPVELLPGMDSELTIR